MKIVPWQEVIDILPPLGKVDKEALKQSIAQDGVKHPILVLPDGRIIDGHHRWELSGGTAPYTVWDLPEDKAFDQAIELNLARRQLSRQQIKIIRKAQKKRRQERKKKALELRAQGLSQQQAADEVGVSRKAVDLWENATIGSDENTTNSCAEIPDNRVRIPKGEHEKIAERLDAGETQREVAADYQVTRQAISRIKAKEEKRRAKKAEEQKKIKEAAKAVYDTGHEQCLYKDDWTQLWCADAADLFFLKDDTVDLIVTSPPYNIGKKKGNGRVLWGGVEYSDSDDEKPEKQYQSEQIKILNEMWRVARPGASLFYNHKVRNRNNKGIHPLEWILKSKWVFRQQIIWDRGSTHNHEMTYFWPIDELIIWLTKGTKNIYLSEEGAQLTTIWRFAFETNTSHPAPFPETLASRCINAASKKGDLVLDPFGGSMTTCAVAKKLKRYSIGVDISERYVLQYSGRCRQEVFPE